MVALQDRQAVETEEEMMVEMAETAGMAEMVMVVVVEVDLVQEDQVVILQVEEVADLVVPVVREDPEALVDLAEIFLECQETLMIQALLSSTV